MYFEAEKNKILVEKIPGMAILLCLLGSHYSALSSYFPFLKFFLFRGHHRMPRKKFFSNPLEKFFLSLRFSAYLRKKVGGEREREIKKSSLFSKSKFFLI